MLKLYRENDDELFPDRHPPAPPPVIADDGHEEWVIQEIIDERTSHRGRRRQFLVRWAGYGPEGDTWEPLEHVEDTEALDRWEAQMREDG